MLLLLMAVLGVQAAPAPDTVEIYSAVLEATRAEVPGVPVVLAETRSGVACMPHCGARLRSPGESPGPEERVEPQDHSGAVLQRLLGRGLIQATCEVPESTFGCAGRPGHVFVGLGEIQASPPRGPGPEAGGLWVRAAFLVPCMTRCAASDTGRPRTPDAYGYWYLLRPGETGRWRVIKRLPAFFI